MPYGQPAAPVGNDMFARIEALRNNPDALRSLAMQPVDPDAVIAHHLAQMANGPSPAGTSPFEGLIEPRGPQPNMMAGGGTNTPGGFDQLEQGYTTNLANSSQVIPTEAVPAAAAPASSAMPMLMGANMLMQAGQPHIPPPIAGAGPQLGAATPAKKPDFLQPYQRSYPIGSLLIGR